MCYVTRNSVSHFLFPFPKKLDKIHTLASEIQMSHVIQVSSSLTRYHLSECSSKFTSSEMTGRTQLFSRAISCSANDVTSDSSTKNTL